MIIPRLWFMNFLPRTCVFKHVGAHLLRLKSSFPSLCFSSFCYAELCMAALRYAPFVATSLLSLAPCCSNDDDGGSMRLVLNPSLVRH